MLLRVLILVHQQEVQESRFTLRIFNVSTAERTQEGDVILESFWVVVTMNDDSLHVPLHRPHGLHVSGQIELSQHDRQRSQESAIR